MFVTPLSSRGRVIGVITYLATQDQPFGEDVRLLAEELAGRIALGLDNSRLFSDMQRAVRAREELLAVVSHDLRNPLGVVHLALGLVAQDPQALPRALPRAQRAVERMQRLIDDLLEIARIDAGTLKVERQPVDLVALIEETCEQCRVLANEKKLRIVTDLVAGLGTIEADRHRLAQVLANLLGNAIKFTPEEGAIFVGASATASEVVLTVSDTGPGIPSEQVAHIFDRFWQAPGAQRRGIGLGLAIVKGIVDAHGGAITVDSEVGRGTTFCVSLPTHVGDHVRLEAS